MPYFVFAIIVIFLFFLVFYWLKFIAKKEKKCPCGQCDVKIYSPIYDKDKTSIS